MNEALALSMALWAATAETEAEARLEYELAGYPTPWVVKANVEFALAHMRWVDAKHAHACSLGSDAADWQSFYRRWSRDADQCHHFWTCLGRAQNRDKTRDMRRDWLERARGIADAYAGGRDAWVPVVPVWYFQRR